MGGRAFSQEAHPVPAKGSLNLLNKITIVHLLESGNTNEGELKEILAANGYHVVANQFKKAISTLPSGGNPDLILLSLTGDKGAGLACCRNLRAAYPQCAICLVHDCLPEWEESIALELGADAVMRHPSDTRRVLAQVRAMLRGREDNQFPSFQLLAGSRTVKVDNQPISLTDAEFELLNVLAKQPGTVVSRDTISRHLRGLEYDGRNRIIDLRIARIRQKLGDRARFPKFIRTVRGEGYMLIVDDS